MAATESSMHAKLGDSALLRPVSDVMQSQLLRCSQHEPLGIALATMQKHSVGSILVDCDDGSTGILTRTDLIERIILPRLELDCTVDKVMSHPIQSLPLESSLLDAMQAMMRWRLRHLPITSGGSIIGLVSEHDLMRQHRNRPDRLMVSIDRAQDEAALILAAQQAANIARQLHREGLGALHIAKMMSLLNDALTRRAIELIVRSEYHHGLPDKPWAWLALGSEARAEQTMVTDQDNAFVVGDESLVPRFLDIAMKVNHLLDRMGFPLCQGGVMAMHEDWCMSLERWITQAQSWLKSPNPRAILKAQIALDFRWVAGDRLLVESLEKGFSTIFAQRSADQLQSAARQSFLRTMLSDLLERGVQAVPAEWQLSLYRMIGGARTKHLCQRDIKLHGTALIVDAVRFLVLSKLSSGQWMPHGTVERLQWLERNHIMSKDEASALIEAFEALTHWRLEKQMAMLAKRSDEHMCASGNRGSDQEMPAPNHINLLALHSNERSHFRAYVQSIAQLRERLRMDFAA